MGDIHSYWISLFIECLEGKWWWEATSRSFGNAKRKQKRAYKEKQRCSPVLTLITELCYRTRLLDTWWTAIVKMLHYGNELELYLSQTTVITLHSFPSSIVPCCIFFLFKTLIWLILETPSAHVQTNNRVSVRETLNWNITKCLF